MSSATTPITTPTTASAVPLRRQVEQGLHDYFALDDFRPLQAAGQAVLKELRQEEAAGTADLFRRLSSASVPAGSSHQYFSSGDTTAGSGGRTTTASPQLQTMRHVQSTPWPKYLSDKIRTELKAHSIMGLFAPLASLAYLTVDTKVYVWNFAMSPPPPGSEDKDCHEFDTPNGQPVVAVGLVPPKKGIFKPFVEWVMVVTTPDQVFLCALARKQTQAITSPGDGGVRSSGHGEAYSLIKTNFVLSTDSVRMLSVTGTASGRIFLGGHDGCVYEMLYQNLASTNGGASSVVTVEQRLDEFYDQGKSVPAVLTVDESRTTSAGHVLATNSTSEALSRLGKRALHSLTHVDDAMTNGGSPPKKCRKINRTSHASSSSSSTPALIASALVPDFVSSTASLLFGSDISGGGRIVDMTVDEERKCLYTLSSKGWVCAYAIADTSGAATKDDKYMRLAAVMDAPATTRTYLEAVSRGQNLAPARVPSTKHPGRIAFPGGGSAAQDGVGGMDGARGILRLSERQASRTNSGQDNVLLPVSLHVVRTRESSHLTLMCVTQGGLRLYLSSLSTSIIPGGSNAATSASRGSSGSLAPSSRFTLCHVRGPPPLSSGTFNSGVDSDSLVGGMSPRILSNMDDKDAAIDASFYEDGVFVLATRDKNSSLPNAPGSLTSPPVSATAGDVVVAACPDSAARKVPKTDAPKDGSKPNTSFPGGITETLSLPMSIATSSSDSAGSLPVLLGGLVWAIASLPDDCPNDALSMTRSSLTPTDSELGGGLPPAFFPPSKVRASNMITAGNGGGGPAGDAIVAHRASFSSTALTVFTNVMTNWLLSRPLRQGIPFRDSFLDGQPTDGPTYRISKHFGSKGFSLTAGESSPRSRSSYGTPSKTTRVARSARLRRGLLRPAVVPLNQFSTQQALPGKQLVALNSGGLHHFEIETVLTNLANVLAYAGESVAENPAVNKFFACYGHKEGCAMCLALAAGCGRTSGNASFGEQIRRRAETVAFAKAFVPRLVLNSDSTTGTGNMYIGATPSDPLVPSGYEFRPSMISEGLVSVFTRLVRPIWYKPLVVVTEGRTVKTQYSSRTKQCPAKVELLVDEATLDDIRRPLRNLLVLVKNGFSRAVEKVPGVEENSMDIDYDGGGNGSTTGALMYSNYMRAGQSGQTTQLATSEAEKIAHLIEEKNIHSLYRLLARVVQLLDLVSILGPALVAKKVREIDWGLLHGLTTSQLVETSEGQERLETMLNSLVIASASENFIMAEPSDDLEDLANSIAEHCYLFFSPGSWFGYRGLRAASEALRYPLGSSQRTMLVETATKQLQNAAQHWHNASLISGRILHAKGHETFEQIARRAEQYNSPLANSVDALVQLGEVAAAVDICLITASNFSTARSKGMLSSRLGLPGSAGSSGFDWEYQLYHKKRDPEQSSNGGTSSSPTSPSHQLAPYGSAVTSKDATDTCYALIFYHLSILLSSRRELADRMVSKCVSASDRSFVTALFQFLLDNGHADDTLLRISDGKVDKWLQEIDRPDLLWRHYRVLHRFADAANVLWTRATNQTLKIPLDERADCLAQCLASLGAALKATEPQGYSMDQLSVRQQEVKEQLQVAKLQGQILRDVDSSKPDLPEGMTQEKYDKLALALINVSELYNDYAAALSMYDNCLRLLHACRKNEVDAIQRLWKTIMCDELLPCATRSPQAQHMLATFASDVGFDEGIVLLTDKGAYSLPLFENGDWVKRLENRIVDLGKELYGTGADFVVPVDFLLFNLEGLRQACGDVVTPGWSLVTLSKVGVPFLDVLDAFDSLSQRDESQVLVDDAHLSKKMDYFSNVFNFLDYWVALAQAMAGEESTAAREELSYAKASGRLGTKLEHWKGRLQAMTDTSELLERLDRFVEAADSLV